MGPIAANSSATALAVLVLATSPAGAAQPEQAHLLHSLAAEVLALDQAQADRRVTAIYADALRRDALREVEAAERASRKSAPALAAAAAEARAAIAQRSTARLQTIERRLAAWG